MKWENKKSQRKCEKRIHKRHANALEVLTIFNMVLADKKTTQILNEIKRKSPHSALTKKHVEKIMTGNCKVEPNELEHEEYQRYITLRQQVYNYWKLKKADSKTDKYLD